jgi:hypothetical protein
MKFAQSRGPASPVPLSLSSSPCLGLAVAARATGVPGGKVKYYRNPMGTPDTSPVPKKDAMNMDYLPVCDDVAGDGPGTVTVSLDKVQRLGVRTEAVSERQLSRTVRAFATLQFDERRQFVVAPKFSGWIEKLYVNATGDAVTGQKLFDVYSPELPSCSSNGGYRSMRPTIKALTAIPERHPSKVASRGRCAPSPSLAVAGTVEKAIEGMRFPGRRSSMSILR